MPLLSPSQIQNVLEQTELKKPKGDSSLKQILEENSLSDSEIIDGLAAIIRGGQSESTKLRAIEMVLKMRGHLTPEAQNTGAGITIVIQDPKAVDVNPILIPR